MKPAAPSFRLVLLIFLAIASLAAETRAEDHPRRFVFLCFGQSNMEGFPGIEEQDRGPVDERFQVLAPVDFPDPKREKGRWYPAVPPLCRPSAGLGPADYLPAVIPTAHVVSSAGCVARRDRLHFAADGYRELGRRYAEAMLPLLGIQPAAAPKPTSP